MFADNHDSDDSQWNVAEYYVSAFKDGKDMDDMMKWAEKWNDWANETDDLKDYTAALLVPYYHSGEQPHDFVWVGLSPNPEAHFKGNDHWFNNGGKLTGSLRYINFNNKAFGILEPGQSKPGSADVYVEGCPQATSWFYNFDGDPTCSRLDAISSFAASEGVSGVLSNYDPKFSHALAADESEDITRETLVANIKYDFGFFDANLIISDRTVTCLLYTSPSPRD